jgi:hypothetical protein
MKKILIEVSVFALPLSVFIFRKLFPNNRCTAYLIPKILKDKEYLKSEFRKAGIAFLVLALWLFSTIFITVFLYPKIPVKDNAVIATVLFFIFPLASLISVVIGVYYLIEGIFGKKGGIRPKLESFSYAEKGKLSLYIKRLKIYTAVNLSCPLILAVLLPIEHVSGTGEKGPVVLFNVSLLIIFIMTLWRMRNYIGKSAMLMDLSETEKEKIFLTLFGVAGIFFVHRHSFYLQKKFKERFNE